MMTIEHNLDPLIADLNSQNSSTRMRAREALVKLGGKAVNALLLALQSDQIRQSADAALALGDIGDKQALKPLLNLRTHPHVLLRINSAQALGKLGYSQIEDYLVEWLETETEILVQIELIYSLVKIGDEKVVPSLVNILTKTESNTLRYLIIRLLGDLGDPTMREVIRPYLNDPDHHVREHTSAALQKLEQPLLSVE